MNKSRNWWVNCSFTGLRRIIGTFSCNRFAVRGARLSDNWPLNSFSGNYFQKEKNE